MWGMIEINDTLQITKEQWFPKVLNYEQHKLKPFLTSDFEGQIPHDTKHLMSLAGVGNKTANVFMGEYLGKNFMAVDTHVFRVSHRLGISKAKNVLDTEKDLTKIFKTDLNILHQGLVLFGRYTCKAIKPKCDECFLSEVCLHKDKWLQIWFRFTRLINGGQRGIRTLGTVASTRP